MELCTMILLGVPALIIFVVLKIISSNVVSPKPFDLNGSHVMITGGSSGIGKAIAAEVLKRGASVTLIARNQSKLDEAKKDLEKDKKLQKTQWIETISLDVSSDSSTIEAALHQHINKVGPVGVLVNNAGIFTSGTFEDMPAAEFKKMMDINYLGSVYITKAVLPSLRSLPNSRMAFISSSAGQMGVFGYSAYSASKFALRGLAEALQMELTPDNVRVTLAFPADTDTEAFHESAKTEPKETRMICEAGGILKVEDVAKGVIDDVVKGKFLSVVGCESQLVTILTAGAAPAVGFCWTVVEVLFMGVIRLVMLTFNSKFDKIIRDQRLENKKGENEKNKKSD